MSSDVADLFASLDERRRPEDVASIALRLVGPQLTDDERAVVAGAARLAERPSWWSMQSSDWERPVHPTKQMATLATLLAGTPLEGPPVDPTDPAAVRAEITRVRAGLEWTPRTRLHRRVQYFLGHLEDKANRVERVIDRRACAVAGRAGLVEQLTEADVAADEATAAFVAYYAARRNVRRQFTLAGKENPFDDVAAALFANVERSPGARWDVIARVYGAPRVTAKLTVDENLRLAAEWAAVMRLAAGLAESCDGVDRMRRHRMSVFAGLDSETWNLAAQAYNEARASWFSALDGAGALDVAIAGLCPPKMMRLMAADLVAWTYQSGGEINPDTAIAAQLPWPWEALSGTRSCTAMDVSRVCGRAIINPWESGWLGPRRPRPASVFAPTPELVHGIVVSDPTLAALLRKAGAWSAKGIRWDRMGEAEAYAGGVLPDRPL